MKRVFWLLPLLILPVLTLGMLAWSLAEQAEDQALSVQRRQHEQMVATCVSAFKHRINALGGQLQQWVIDLRSDVPSAEPPALGQAWTVVFDADGRCWYPPKYSAGPQDLAAASAGGAGTHWAELLAEAARLEQSSPSTELAAEQYAALDRDPAPASVRATAVLGLARCMRRLGRTGEVTRLYRRAATEFAGTLDQTGMNLGAEAAAANFKFAQGTGEPVLTAQAWREYADGLVGERFAMPWAAALAHVTGAWAQVPLAADAPDDLERRRKLVLAKEQLEQMEYAVRMVPAASATDIAHLLPRDDLLLLAQPVRSAEPAVFVVAAFAMEWVQQNIARTLIGELNPAGNTRLCIRDDSSHRLIAGEEPPAGPMRTEASLLDSGLPWTVCAGFANLQALQAQASRRKMLLSGSIAGLVALIGVATLLAVRMVQREMELSQLKSDFVDNVSHELRTPVTSIKLFSQMLSTGQIIEPDKQREYHRLLSSESDRLMRIVENMLDFSRIVAGRMRLRFETVDVAEYLAELHRQLLIQARPTGHKIHLHLGRDLPTCVLDRDSIGRAVANLVSNAIKYSAKDREITLTAQRRDGMLSIMVRDRGVGIPPQDLPHVFERFYRARHRDTEHIQGTGLGLTIVKDTVQRHGGTVRIDSRLGEGTVVELLLPIHPGAAAREKGTDCRG